jgi:hypothetical protein
MAGIAILVAASVMACQSWARPSGHCEAPLRASVAETSGSIELRGDRRRIVGTGDKLQHPDRQ